MRGTFIVLQTISSLYLASLYLVCGAAIAGSETEAALRAQRANQLTVEQPARARIDAPAPTQPSTSATAPDDIATIPGVFDVDPNGRPTKTEFSTSLSELAAKASKGSKQNIPGIIDFWVEGKMQTVTPIETPGYAAGIAGTESTTGIVYLGNKVMVSPDVMVGALTQIDRVGEINDRHGAETAAAGWLAGPYVSMLLAPGVVFDGRAAWGQSDVSSTDGAFTHGDSRLIKGRLTGTRDVGSWKLAPSIGFSHLEDGAAETVAAPASQGRIDVLPQVSRRYAIDNETFIEPRLTAGGFMAFDDPTHLAPGGDADLRMKAEAGVGFGNTAGTNVQATAGVESGGVAATDTWTGRLQLNMPLGK